MKHHIDIALYEIRKDIQEFRKKTGLSKSLFGRKSVNDAHAIDLIDSMRPKRLRKIESFMRDYEAGKKTPVEQGTGKKKTIKQGRAKNG